MICERLSCSDYFLNQFDNIENWDRMIVANLGFTALFVNRGNFCIFKFGRDATCRQGQISVFWFIHTSFKGAILSRISRNLFWNGDYASSILLFLITSCQLILLSNCSLLIILSFLTKYFSLTGQKCLDIYSFSSEIIMKWEYEELKLVVPIFFLLSKYKIKDAESSIFLTDWYLMTKF